MSDAITRLNAALEGRYAIEREGGMAARFVVLHGLHGEGRMKRRRMQLGSLAVCTVAAWLGTSCGGDDVNGPVTVAPLFGPLVGKIAFMTTRDGDFEIYLMNADGTGLIRLTDNTAIDDRGPAWSPDGTKIAFMTDRDGNSEIYVMNADGTGLVNLTNNTGYEVHPEWSPAR